MRRSQSDDSLNKKSERGQADTTTREAKHVKFLQVKEPSSSHSSNSPSFSLAGTSSTAWTSTSTSSTPSPSRTASAHYCESQHHDQNETIGSRHSTPTPSRSMIKRVMSSIEFHQHVVDNSCTFAERLEHDKEQFVTSKYEVV